MIDESHLQTSFAGTLNVSVPTAVNGRYERLERGGYRRYAQEITRHLGAPVHRPPDWLWGGARGRFWEQSALLRATRNEILLSPANSGPLGHPRQVLVLHDLFALQQPEWYAPGAARLQRMTLPRLAGQAAAVIAPSTRVADDICTELGIRARNVHVVHPAVGMPFGPAPSPTVSGIHALTLRRRLRLDEDRRLVFGLVSGVVRKNSAHLLDVLADLAERRPDITVAVAGV